MSRFVFTLSLLAIALVPQVVRAELITFEVDVPRCTPVDAVVYLRSNRLEPELYLHDELTQISPTRWQGTFDVVTGRDLFRYKYSHSLCDDSSCVGIEKSLTYDGSGGEVDDRILPVGVTNTDDLVFIWRSAMLHFDASGQSLGVRADEEQVAFCSPYLSVSTVDGSEITVGYDAYNGGEVLLEWGETPAYGSSLSQDGAYRNHFTLPDLEPGRLYHYRVTEDGVAGEDHTFTAPPDGGEPFRFAFFGDTQYYVEQQRLDHASFTTMVRDFGPDLVVGAGDMVASELGEPGPGGWRFPEMGRWNVFFGVAASLLASAPYLAAMGNHEEDAHYFWDAFAFPEPDSPAIDHYDFRFGAVHFFVLYTGSTDGYDVEGILDSQSIWLEDALAVADADSEVRWKVVVLHRGPMSQGASHLYDGLDFFEGGSATRASWRELWQSYGVDLVLAGHNHNFTLAAFEGIRYITACSGAPLHDLREPWEETTIVAERTCTANLFTLGTRTLSFEALRGDGSTIDEARFSLCREDGDCEELESGCSDDTSWTCEGGACIFECLGADGDADGDIDADSDIDADGDVDGDADIDADGDADGDADADASADGAVTDADTEPGATPGCGCRVWCSRSARQKSQGLFLRSLLQTL